MPSKGFLNSVVLVVIVILAGIAAYFLWNKPIRRNEPPPVAQPPAGQPATQNNVPQDETANWKTYRNEEVGITFKYPPEYCVGYFPERILKSLGNAHGEEYFIKIAEDAGCASPASPGDLVILAITAYPNQDRSTKNWRKLYNPYELKEFPLSPTVVDGITATRLIVGEGIAEKGIPIYHVFFQKSNSVFVLSASNVDVCVFKNTPCKSPQDQQFIVERADEIIKTIQFVR